MTGSATEGSGNATSADPGRGGEHWNLRLYVAGQSPKSLKAFANLTRMCEEYLPEHYEIEIIDLVCEHECKG